MYFQIGPVFAPHAAQIKENPESRNLSDLSALQIHRKNVKSQQD